VKYYSQNPGLNLVEANGCHRWRNWRFEQVEPKRSWRGPTGHRRVAPTNTQKKSWEMIVNSDVVDIYNLWKTRTPRKTQKNNHLVKTKGLLNIKVSCKGGPVFSFILLGGCSPPCPPSVMPVAVILKLHVSQEGCKIWSKQFTCFYAPLSNENPHSTFFRFLQNA